MKVLYKGNHKYKYKINRYRNQKFVSRKTDFTNIVYIVSIILINHNKTSERN